VATIFSKPDVSDDDPFKARIRSHKHHRITSHRIASHRG
jgi:hypothetical protein